MFNLFSVPISITSKSQALATVSQWMIERTKDEGRRTNSPQPSVFSLKIITTPNPEMVVAAQKDPEFLKALQSADLAIPDGIGIVWAIKLLSVNGLTDKQKNRQTDKQINRQMDKQINRQSDNPIIGSSDNQIIRSSIRPIVYSSINQITCLSGLDFMEALIEESAKNGWKVMLLGGKPGVGEKAAKSLKERMDKQINRQSDNPIIGSSDNQIIRSSIRPIVHSSINQITSLSGPEDIDKASPSQLNNLINSINSFSPDLLFVAFGHGKQEKWLNANRYRLNVRVAMGVGGALDQIADPSLRPPAYINSIGLGWLYRLLREPWRWRRQLALVRFAGMVLRQKFQFSSSKLQ